MSRYMKEGLLQTDMIKVDPVNMTPGNHARDRMEAR